MILINYCIVIKNNWVYLGFLMVSMKKCVICYEDYCNIIFLIKKGEKGSKGILKVIREREDNLEI